MTWVGMFYLSVQQQVTVGPPGGQTIYRVITTCGCGHKAEYLITPGNREGDVAKAFSESWTHALSHM